MPGAVNRHLENQASSSATSVHMPQNATWHCSNGYRWKDTGKKLDLLFLLFIISIFIIVQTTYVTLWSAKFEKGCQTKNVYDPHFCLRLNL